MEENNYTIGFTEIELKQLFAEHGEVIKVDIIGDKGFGYQFKNGLDTNLKTGLKIGVRAQLYGHEQIYITKLLYIVYSIP